MRVPEPTLQAVGIGWEAEKEVLSVTHLHQLMLEELQRRNLAETTIRSYIHGVEHFMRASFQQVDSSFWSVPAKW
jgi:hypothetical protein